MVPRTGPAAGRTFGGKGLGLSERGCLSVQSLVAVSVDPGSSSQANACTPLGIPDNILKDPGRAVFG